MDKPIKDSRSLEREQLKRFYKTQRYDDRKIGLKKNELFQRFHQEMRIEPEKRDIESLKSIVEQLKEIRQTKLFRNEFPTLSSFKKYLKKENVTIKDLL